MIATIITFFTQLTRIGINENMPYKKCRQIMIGNLSAIAGITAGFTTVLLMTYMSYDQVGAIILIPGFFVCVYFIVPFLYRSGHLVIAGNLLIINTCLSTMTNTYISGQALGIHLYFILLTTLPFLVFDQTQPKERKYPIISLILAIIMFLTTEFFFSYDPPKIILPELFVLGMYAFHAIITFTILFAIIWYFYQDILRAKFLLERENKRSDKLLRNILPDVIAEQLKDDGQTIAKEHKEVTVLFADIVDFTQLSDSISASSLVTLLNHIFSMFDHITDKYQLEKIKTIGDAYMLVGGLQANDTDHIIRVVNAAFDMQQALLDYTLRHKIPLDIRIGIHTGPAVAGVIGIKKFSYDIWGDTVNTASRLESNGEAGRIHISEIVYKKVKQLYQCISRGKIQLKGLGMVSTFFLEKNKTDDVL